MRKLLFSLAAISLLAAPAHAALKKGAKAPDIKAVGANAGKPYNFDLAEALKKGPVVLYFFPKANTRGCDLEAHAYSEAIEKFRTAGATVIGMSADDTDTLKVFSTAKCAGAFPVATATPAIKKAYDVAWTEHPPLTTRTSYVINRKGRIVAVHDDPDWSGHVSATLAAVRALK